MRAEVVVMILDYQQVLSSPMVPVLRDRKLDSDERVFGRGRHLAALCRQQAAITRPVARYSAPARVSKKGCWMQKSRCLLAACVYRHEGGLSWAVLLLAHTLSHSSRGGGLMMNKRESGRGEVWMTRDTGRNVEINKKYGHPASPVTLRIWKSPKNAAQFI